jgi:hypothetical protein
MCLVGWGLDLTIYIFLSQSDLIYLLHCKCRELSCHLITLNSTHTREESSGRGIGPSQRSIPDSIQHSRETDIHVLRGIRTRNRKQRATADLYHRPESAYYSRRNCTIHLVVSLLLLIEILNNTPFINNGFGWLLLIITIIQMIINNDSGRFQNVDNARRNKGRINHISATFLIYYFTAQIMNALIGFQMHLYFYVLPLFDWTWHYTQRFVPSVPTVAF